MEVEYMEESKWYELCVTLEKTEDLCCSIKNMVCVTLTTKETDFVRRESRNVPTTYTGLWSRKSTIQFTVGTPTGRNWWDRSHERRSRHEDIEVH